MLQIKNLTIQYGDRLIIDNQDLSFEHGRITGIKGVSGAGKSSLLNVIGLIKTPNKECEYIYNGEHVEFTEEKVTSAFRMNHIGFIFQQGNLLNNLTTTENVMLPLMMSEADQTVVRDRAKEWIQYVGLEELGDCYPEDLSGGEEQRITIARALINDSDIILADEPTASLDEDNRNKVMELLRELAYELGKIVIVVSHDSNVINFCDEVYEIKERRLEKTYTLYAKETSTELEGCERDKKKLSFIRNYEKMRRRESKLNIALVVITAIIIALAAISITFGEGFVNGQRKFINAISDRSMLVINDSMGLKATGYYESAQAFEDGIIDSINKLDNVDKVYPYYEFTCTGYSDNKADVSVIKLYKGQKVEGQLVYNEECGLEDYWIVPMYPEENFSGYMLYGKGGESQGVVLSYQMAKAISSDLEALIGKELEISCFVPTKLCISEAEFSDGKIVPIDLPVSKLVTINVKITGILDNTYKYEKSSNNMACFIMMNFPEMYDIIEANIGDLSKQTFENFPEKKLAPSTLVVYATDYDEILSVKGEILKLDSRICIMNRSLDLEAVDNNLKLTRRIAFAVSAVLIAIVMLIFGLLYYYKNRDRKKEIGILKALGLSDKDALGVVGYNMARNTIYTIVLSIVFMLGLMVLINALFQGAYVSITAVSIVLIVVISIIAVFVSGMVSVWKTSKIDIVDAIRTNR